MKKTIEFAQDLGDLALEVGRMAQDKENEHRTEDAKIAIKLVELLQAIAAAPTGRLEAAFNNMNAKAALKGALARSKHAIRFEELPPETTGLMIGAGPRMWTSGSMGANMYPYRYDEKGRLVPVSEDDRWMFQDSIDHGFSVINLLPVGPHGPGMARTLTTGDLLSVLAPDIQVRVVSGELELTWGHMDQKEVYVVDPSDLTQELPWIPDPYESVDSSNPAKTKEIT
jgi:hypothetical protein